MSNRPSRRRLLAGAAAAGGLGLLGRAGSAWPAQAGAEPAHGLRSWPLAAGKRTGIHDVAPAPDGGVWFTAQGSGHLGWFDPRSGRTELVALGGNSAPHGVVLGPDGAAWITDGGQNAIVRVTWPQREVQVFPLPEGSPYANLNTCVFDAEGVLWFTGQSGVVGRLVPRTREVSVEPAPRGVGPYGICATPNGEVWYCSLAQSFIARIDRATGKSTIVAPPTPEQGARRIWSDSRGRLWVSEWTSGNLSMHDPAARSWKTWKLPGRSPHVYAVYVDERDNVWVSEWSANAIVRFDPETERFDPVVLPRSGAAVRQIAGRRGEVWFGESGAEHVSMVASG